MIELQYWDGETWLHCGLFLNEDLAWVSLGGDDDDYRTIDPDGNILTDKTVLDFEPPFTDSGGYVQ